MRNTVLIGISAVVLMVVFVGAYFYFQSDSRPPSPLPTEGDDTVVLGLGEEKRFGEIILTLEKVENDSRCPLDVSCVTPGELTARLSVRAGNEATVLPISMVPNEQWFAGHFIMISEVYPAAYSNRAIAQQEYRVQFRITPGDRPQSLATESAVTEELPVSETASTSATSSPPAIASGDYVEGDREMRRVVDNEYNFVFSYRVAPTGYVLVTDEVAAVTPTPLVAYTLYSEAEYEAFKNAGDSSGGAPPSIQIRVFANPEQQTGEAWARANPAVAYTSNETRFIPLTVGGQAGFLYNAVGPYPMSNLLISYADSLYLITGFYRERTDPIYRDFDNVMQSLSFLNTESAVIAE